MKAHLDAEEERKMLRLYFVEGLSVLQVAKKLGRAQSTIHNRIRAIEGGFSSTSDYRRRASSKRKDEFYSEEYRREYDSGLRLLLAAAVRDELIRHNERVSWLSQKSGVGKRSLQYYAAARRLPKLKNIEKLSASVSPLNDIMPSFITAYFTRYH